MCKCLQYCLESCYWHLIEKRFCYDESIALYEAPSTEKDEKNNNMFDNFAFYDSVAVIAGRAVVTIDPLPTSKEHIGSAEEKPIVHQPSRRKLRWELEEELERDEEEKLNSRNNKEIIDDIMRSFRQKNGNRTVFKSRSVPTIVADPNDSDEENKDPPDDASSIKEQRISSASTTTMRSTTATTTRDEPDNSGSANNQETETKNSSITSTATSETRLDPSKLQPLKVVDYLDPEVRRKSLRERRMSKSLYLKIDQPKELPLIRQQSMPKFYLDTPGADVRESSIARTPSAALTSPVPTSSGGFIYDLYSVVQIEKQRAQTMGQSGSSRELTDKSSRLTQIKEKIKLKRIKSGQNLPITNLPHSHHHI